MVLTRNDLEDIACIVESKISAVLTNEEFIKNICEKVSQKLADRLEKQSSSIDNLTTAMEDLKAAKHRFEKQIDDMRQYSKVTNLRIFGVPQRQGPENTKEIVLDICKNRLKLGNLVREMDIKNCYRVKTKNAGVDNGRLPAILVTFYSENKKTQVLKCRKLLKSTGMSIQEDLTARRLNLLKMAAEKYTRNNVWVHDGRVCVKNGGKIRRINHEDDLV